MCSLKRGRGRWDEPHLPSLQKCSVYGSRSAHGPTCSAPVISLHFLRTKGAHTRQMTACHMECFCFCNSCRAAPGAVQTPVTKLWCGAPASPLAVAHAASRPPISAIDSQSHSESCSARCSTPVLRALTLRRPQATAASCVSTKRPDWSCLVGSDQASSHSIAFAVEQATDGPPGTVASMPLP